MIYKKFSELSLSALGFGTMRLPLLDDGSIDQKALDEMVDYAIENGVNYFDTAVPYHSGTSEIAIGKALRRHPKEKWYLADKYPGHQISSHYDPAATFEEQLEKCGVDYFDFYLLHNINENSIGTYMNEDYGIVKYFVEQRRLGRIKHLGFSCHSMVEGLEEFLDYCGDEMEFCQIQLNYLDWTLQNAKAKYELLCDRGLPVWVMEPLRGGKLSKMPGDDDAKFKALRPDESISAWGFRFLQGLENVTMVLSGMSNLEQMVDNVKTFSEHKPLNAEETVLAFAAAEKIKNALPCTGCRYCCDGCPVELDIPRLISLYMDAKFYPSINVSMQYDAMPEDKVYSACIGCGQCSAICPQSIDVPKAMKEADALFATLPKWADICREREEAAAREKAAKNK